MADQQVALERLRELYREKNEHLEKFLAVSYTHLDVYKSQPQLRDTLHQMKKDLLPQATFVVNSGTGLHLYYVLKEPVPMYPHLSLIHI